MGTLFHVGYFTCWFHIPPIKCTAGGDKDQSNLACCYFVYGSTDWLIDWLDPVVRRLWRPWYAYCLPSHAVVPKAERVFFSGLCRLKTHLRSSTSQGETQPAPCHFARSPGNDRWNWRSVSCEWFCNEMWRMSTFGRVCWHVNRADSCSVFETVLYDTYRKFNITF